MDYGFKKEYKDRLGFIVHTQKKKSNTDYIAFTGKSEFYCIS